MELQEYNRNFDSKIAVFSTPVVMLDDEEVKNLGRKEEETEVEKFITSNTQELGKDKWLCPLSGKKFKGPEFVRKHITNKHGEKLDEVRKEVCILYFYILKFKFLFVVRTLSDIRFYFFRLFSSITSCGILGVQRIWIRTVDLRLQLRAVDLNHF